MNTIYHNGHFEFSGSNVSRSAGHEITEQRSPISIKYVCSCGWRHTETRRQNAFARNAKLEAARRKHLLESAT